MALPAAVGGAKRLYESGFSMNSGCNRLPDYYEELGVPPSASREELQRALRSLARMIHPDLQQDDRTRKLAESQTKRLNDIRSVLLNSTNRSHYDRELRSGLRQGNEPVHLPPLIDPPKAQSSKPWPWSFAAIAIVAGLGFFLWPPTAGSVQPIKNQVLSEEALPPVTQSTRKPKRRAPVKPVSNSAALPVMEFESPPRVSHASAILEPAHPIVEIAPPAKVPDTTKRGVAGVWVYAMRSNAPASEKSYTPEYVQVRIEESGSVLKGVYEAKYRVTDPAISPLVSFHFFGSGRSLGNLPWSARDGSVGHLSLNLADAEHLVLVWTAESLGTELGLVSGSAHLVRFQEP